MNYADHLGLRRPMRRFCIHRVRSRELTRSYWALLSPISPLYLHTPPAIFGTFDEANAALGKRLAEIRQMEADQ